MPSFNKVIVVGYIGRDAELHQDREGDMFCAFPVATPERARGANARRKNPDTWFRICIRGQQAEYFSMHLTKGMKVYVEGRLAPLEYQDDAGTTRTSLDVRATDIQVLQGTDDIAQMNPVSLTQAGHEFDEALLST